MDRLKGRHMGGLIRSSQVQGIVLKHWNFLQKEL